MSKRAYMLVVTVKKACADVSEKAADRAIVHEGHRPSRRYLIELLGETL